MKPEKLVEGMHIYITQLDFYRPPISFGLLPWSYKLLFKLLFKSMSQYYFFSHCKDLYRKTRKDLDPFFKALLKVSLKDHFILYVVIMGWLIFSVIICVTIFKEILISILFSVIIGLSGLYLIMAWSFTKRRRIAGETYNEEIKVVTQGLIDYSIEFFKKEGLNPLEFPIKLKNDDYTGLSYKNNGKNYMGYVVLNE